MSDSTSPSVTPTATPPAAALPPFTVSAEYAAKQVAQPQTAPTVKPGFLTSEFWLHVIALAAPLLYDAFAHSSSPALIAAAQAGAAIYTLARTIAKR